MKPAPDHVDEPRRVTALHRLGLLDTGAEERFDRITRLLATVLDVPIALVSLVDSHRQWFKSRVGLEAEQTGRDVSFCGHAIVADPAGPFVVSDARFDPRFHDNPLVTGDPRIRFYAGQVLRDTAGLPMGTLCAIDRRPRNLSAAQVQSLVDLAHLVEQEMQRDAERSLLVELDRSERRKALILETLTEGIVMQGSDGRILDWNRAAERVLGLSADELGGRTSVDPRWGAVHEDGTPWPGDTHPAMEALRTSRPVKGKVMGIDHPHGGRVWLRVNANPVLDDDGVANSVLTAFSDVTVEHQLMVEQRRFGYLFRNAADIITVIDEAGTIRYTSPSAERVLGQDPSEPAGRTIWDAMHPEDQQLVRSMLDAVIAGNATAEPVTARVHTDSGAWRHLECIAVNLLDEDAVQGLVVTARDITERHEAAELLAHRALHDELTELPNRRRLSAKIGSALERAADEDRQVALCFVDLDRFKTVNDTYGHDAGDRLLVAAANAIRGSARHGDCAARVGGDEFVVLLDPVTGDDEAVAIATAIRESIAEAHGAGLPPAAFGASIGVAISRPGDTPSLLLQRADEALYLAKESRGCVRTVGDGDDANRSSQRCTGRPVAPTGRRSPT